MTKGRPINTVRCCTCNGQAAKCKKCKCAKSKVPCSNCAAPNCSNHQHIQVKSIINVHDSENHVHAVSDNVENQTGHTARDAIRRLPWYMETFYEIIHWVPNLMTLPRCNATKDFIATLTSHIKSFNENSKECDSILHLSSVYCQLILQQIPSRRISDRRKTLERRIIMWNEKKYDQLISEARFLQKQRSMNRKKNHQKGFLMDIQKLVQYSKIGEAARLLKSGGQISGIHEIDSFLDGKTVLTRLQELHPRATDADGEYILLTPLKHVIQHHQVIYMNLSPEDIIKAAKKSNGSAGPSGMDAQMWRYLLTGFGQESYRLANVLAMFAIKIATERLNPNSLEAYLACRLVPLDKSPGIRPIGIGEVMRRIVARAQLKYIKPTLMEVAGAVQMCAGQKCGTDTIIHNARDILESNSEYCILTVDANNAFNCINRDLLLKNINAICPAMTTLLINTYSKPSLLIVAEETILSEEGVTQGDPLAMAAFAAASLPIIEEIKQKIPGVTQLWYADDATFIGRAHELSQVWDLLKVIGKSFGFHINASKCCFLNKNETMTNEAKYLMQEGVKVVKNGIKVLGGFIGCDAYRECQVMSSINSWRVQIQHLCDLADLDPYAAYILLTRTIQFQWTHLVRTTKVSSSWFRGLADDIFLKLIPSIMGLGVLTLELRDIIKLPARDGGLGIIDPSANAEEVFKQSHLIANANVIHSNSSEIGEILKDLCDGYRKNNRNIYEQLKKQILENASEEMARSIQHAAQKNASIWLTSIPSKPSGFYLQKQQFLDALAIRYNIPIKSKGICRCSEVFNLRHVLSCRVGGGTIIRHNAIRDTIGSILSEAHDRMDREVELRPVDEGIVFASSTTTRDRSARMDIVCMNFSEGRMERSYVDICVFNHLAPSYAHQTVSSTFDYHSNRKMAKYGERVSLVEDGIFIPAIVSTAAGIGRELDLLLRKAARYIAIKSKQSYANCISDIRRRLCFSAQRTISATIRMAELTTVSH